jgi:hypothetical protein
MGRSSSSFLYDVLEYFLPGAFCLCHSTTTANQLGTESHRILIFWEGGLDRSSSVETFLRSRKRVCVWVCECVSVRVSVWVSSTSHFILHAQTIRQDHLRWWHANSHESLGLIIQKSFASSPYCSCKKLENHYVPFNEVIAKLFGRWKFKNQTTPSGLELKIGFGLGLGLGLG